jgi:transposase-like protein
VQGYPPLEAVGEAAAEALRRFVQQPEFQPHPLTVEEHDSMASKFTPEIQATIIEALRENPSVPSAASKAGISPVTLNRWLQQGEEGSPEFAEFALEAAEARRTMKDEIVAALYKTATDELHPQQTKAAHLLLTNLYPQEFANVKHTVTHKSKDPEIDLSSLSQEELRAFHKTLKRVTKGDDSVYQTLPVTVIDVSTNAKAEA